MGALIKSTQLLLSSKTVEYVVEDPRVVLVVDIMSSSKYLKGSKSLIACDKAIYSASVVLKATSVCSLDAHKKGRLVNRMTYPFLDFTDDGSDEVKGVQFPAKSAST